MSLKLLTMEEMYELPKWSPDPKVIDGAPGMYHSDNAPQGARQIQVDGVGVIEVPHRPYKWMVSPTGNIVAVPVRSSRNYDKRKRAFGDDGNYQFAIEQKKRAKGFIDYEVTEECLAEINSRRTKAFARGEQYRKSFRTEEQKLKAHADKGIDAVFDAIAQRVESGAIADRAEKNLAASIVDDLEGSE